MADAWPVSPEVFHANIDKPRGPAEVTTESVKPEPVAISAQPEPVEASPAAEEKEEDARAEPNVEGPASDAAEEDAPAETDATPPHPAAENEAQATSESLALPKRYKLPDEELMSLNRRLLQRAYPESEQDVSTRNYSIGLGIFTTLLNNASSLLIFLCFNILNMPTKIKSGTGRVGNAYLYAGVALISIMALAEVLMVAYPVSHQGRYDVLQRWSHVSGFLGGVAMALYFGRLQSVFLGAPKWLVVLLFVYTLIQSLFFFLEERDDLAVVLMNFALLMKCLLFLYMSWLFASGRLLFYLVRVRRTHNKVLEEFPTFRRVLDKES